ncbi:hypothetical protein MTQ93_09605 [Staphylococcus agnetis]|uniref:hypothetical protein n=1 Tax=Staphylococcus agnetis TaxID=985762 RepID=UPI00208F60A7|nr:hypothetical protein [Staphylococcus agnetis]MCO4346299.1 hypothetical protein [Staphylococcus agnetis]MCO4360625.1 hypothetical protein [Staphylococcus agnetis]
MNLILRKPKGRLTNELWRYFKKYRGAFLYGMGVVIFSLIYLRCVVSANMMMLDEYNQKPLKIPWYLNQNVLLKQVDQSYATANFFWGFLLSIALSICIFRFIKAIYKQALIKGSKHQTWIGIVGYIFQIAILPLFIFSTYWTGVEVSTFFENDKYHFMFFIGRILFAFGDIGIFLFIILMGYLVWRLPKMNLKNLAE